MSRILLVDDDMQAADALLATLRALGHEAMWAHDAPEGEANVQTFRPDVVLADLNLPGMSGMDWISHLAEDPNHRFLCLATGMADYRLLKQTMAAGAWSMLSKPFALPDVIELLRTAERLLNAVRKDQKLLTQVASAPLSLSGSDDVNLEELLATVMHYTQTCGADIDTATRVVPIVVYELLTNAQRHGLGQVSLTCIADGDDLNLRIAHGGSAFGWQRELAGQRMNWERSKARGLQLVSAITTDFHYEDDGRAACAVFPKVSRFHRVSAAISMAVQ